MNDLKEIYVGFKDGKPYRRENKKMMFPSSSQTKNIMSKYSYNKPMTPGEYRTNEIKYRGINLK